MSRTPFTGLTPNPLIRKQIAELDTALRRTNETLAPFVSNDAQIQRGPLGSTMNIRRQTPRDFDFLGMLVNNGPSGTETDFTDARYWVQSIQPTQVALAIPTDVAKPYSDGQFWIVATNLGEATAGTHLLPVVTPNLTSGLPAPANATLVGVTLIDAAKRTDNVGDVGNTIYICEPLSSVSNSGIVIVKRNGTDGSSNPLYDLYSQSDTTYITKLNSAGALAPKCSRARFIVTGVTITAAADGSTASSYSDTTGAIQLFDCQETICTGS